jgi:hypothetical protein
MKIGTCLWKPREGWLPLLVRKFGATRKRRRLAWPADRAGLTGRKTGNLPVERHLTGNPKAHQCDGAEDHSDEGNYQVNDPHRYLLLSRPTVDQYEPDHSTGVCFYAVLTFNITLIP